MIFNFSFCKGSANRAKYKEKTHFFFYFRGAAYLRAQLKGTIKRAEYKKKKQFSFLLLSEST
ncbi:hypothetical protein CIK89_02640 [Prevotella sp. P4-119]|nr:hypothetical protein CIK89_02640 [Prevotella sp. P4-119]